MDFFRLKDGTRFAVKFSGMRSLAYFERFTDVKSAAYVPNERADRLMKNGDFPLLAQQEEQQQKV